MAKYRVDTDNGSYEVETEESLPLGEQPATFGGVAKTMASQAGTALSTAASDIAGAPAAIAGAIRHPIDTLKAGISTPKPPQVPEAQLPQDVFHRAQRALGGGPNNLPPADTPTAEVVGHGLALGAMSAAPAVIGKLPKAVDTAMERLPQGGGINPDVRAGAVKMAAGAAGAELLPGPLKWPARILGLYPGARQLWRGLNSPDTYAKETVAELPTIKNPSASAPPAVFGNAADFAKLPQSVQDAVLRGQATIPRGPSAPAPAAPRGMEHYGVTPPAEAPSAPAPTISAPDLSKTLSSLKQKAGIPEGQHLGEAPGAHYPERWAGSDSPTIRSTMAKTKFVRVNPEEVGVHGGVEGTPIKGPLNTPEKIRIARELANELKKNAKGGK